MASHLISQLIYDEATQVRAAESDAAIDAYAEAIKNGVKMPRPVVFKDTDGALWVADGHHTVRAYVSLRVERIDVDVRKGTARDARLYAYTANLSHGVQLTMADKRKIVEGMIRDTDWGDRKIAKHLQFWSHEKVRGVRKEMAGKLWRRPIPGPSQLRPLSEGPYPKSVRHIRLHVSEALYQKLRKRLQLAGPHATMSGLIAQQLESWLG